MCTVMPSTLMLKARVISDGALSHHSCVKVKQQVLEDHPRISYQLTATHNMGFVQLGFLVMGWHYLWICVIPKLHLLKPHLSTSQPFGSCTIIPHVLVRDIRFNVINLWIIMDLCSLNQRAWHFLFFHQVWAVSAHPSLLLEPISQWRKIADITEVT